MYKTGRRHFEKTFKAMHPLEVYNLNQAASGLTIPGIRHAYSAPLYIRRGHGVDNFFRILFRWVRPLLCSGAKAIGRETLRTGGKILINIAKRDDVSAWDTVSKHLTVSAKIVISKLRVRGSKRARGEAVASKKNNKKRHLFLISLQSLFSKRSCLPPPLK